MKEGGVALDEIKEEEEKELLRWVEKEGERRRSAVRDGEKEGERVSRVGEGSREKRNRNFELRYDRNARGRR